MKRPDLTQDIELLYAEFKSLVPPATVVAERYMGLQDRDYITRLINTGGFPLPAFKARPSRDAPYLIHIKALAEYLNDLKNEAA